MMPADAQVRDGRALVAIDLGAESCRVSLLRWRQGAPEITLVHRFANAPVQSRDGSLRWDLGMIEDGVMAGLRQAADLAPEGIRAVAADGWAVDYVRTGEDGLAIDAPFCYRDLRTVAAEAWLHERIKPALMREITGVQLQRINTVYQLVADRQAGLGEGAGWLQLPEYLLHRLGGRRVAEMTNAAHGQLVDVEEGRWSCEIFRAAGLDVKAAPQLVEPGTDLGRLRGPLAELPAYQITRLIAPACHDTAAAIAGIAALGDDWAYISSGTWSLVGTLVREPIRGPAAAAFTNLAAAGGLTCFHANVNGMWLVRQCMDEWQAHPDAGPGWTVGELVAAAERLPAPRALLDVDAPGMLLPGGMLGKINAQLAACGQASFPEHPEHAPRYANLIFHSLAARYHHVLVQLAALTGKQLRRVFIVGGGSRNGYLNRLIGARTGLTVLCGSAESSTLGNFAIQLATLEGEGAPPADVISRYAAALKDAPIRVV